MLDNPNVRALIGAIIAGALAAIVPVQQGLGWDDAIIAFLVTSLPLLAAMYGTPINKSVGVGAEALNRDGEPAQP